MSFDKTTLADIDMQKLELFTQVNKLYNSQHLQDFFNEFLKNVMLMEWLKEITNGKYMNKVNPESGIYSMGTNLHKA